MTRCDQIYRAGPPAAARSQQAASRSPPRKARAGEYRVEITASRLSDRADSMSLDGMTMAYSMIQYLPARYNAESELVATVRSSGKNVYTFELTTESEQR
jgi:hypothetical protein